MLNKAYIDRETFDPSIPRHLDSFDVFLKTGNWGEVQFYPELPYTDVPMTCLMKFAEYQQGVKRETVTERQVRIAAIVGITQWPNQKQQYDTNKAEAAARLVNGNRLMADLLKQYAPSN